MTVQAQNNLWQKYRDEASFAFQFTENEAQRTHQLASVAIANQFARNMFDAQLDAETSKEVSGFLEMFCVDYLKKLQIHKVKVYLVNRRT